MDIFRLGGKYGPEVEQLVVYALEDYGHLDHVRIRARKLLGGQTGCSGKAVQLIHRAIGIDTARIFGQPLTAHQTGLTLVSTLGVDPVQRESRFVESLTIHRHPSW